MSKAVKCCICGYVYKMEISNRYGVCLNCNYNNDIVPIMMTNLGEGPKLVDSDNIFQFLDKNDQVIKGKKFNFSPAGEEIISERLKRIQENGE